MCFVRIAEREIAATTIEDTEEGRGSGSREKQPLPKVTQVPFSVA